jgi:hypothetical protein
MKITWPEGKRFAFTVFDDTDLAVPGNYEKVYDCLADAGLKTTKSVWPTTGKGFDARSEHGSTCDDKDYLKHVLSLQKQGFEIGYHLSFHSGLLREEIRRGLDRFKDYFGHDPVSMSNHASSREGIYWGPARLSAPLRWVYRALMRRPFGSPHDGENPKSPYFWGDICRERIRYVRNFVYGDIDSLGAAPMMPYHDPRRPYVNAWYTSTHAPEIETCVSALSEARQDQLEESGGACILYTHFAAGFQKNGALDPRFAALVKRLGKKGGWFVPVGTLLDHVAKAHGGIRDITALERQRLEFKWFKHKVSVGGTS